MSESEAQALLGRLVAQFASPYDFLRELVQNSLDAGSDRVEVSLDAIPSEENVGDSVVYSLSISDTGSGMDEAIIDGGLTRLFATTKADDRTMAGGFGIGFVSVFAWQPEAVLVQTGRTGESWEVLFFGGSRSFEKRRLEAPVEGTTVTLLRRGSAREGPQIAEAVRDSLWRWCRYCRLEITFEDLCGDDPLELIQDSPASQGGELSVHESAGDHSIRVGFAVPSRAVLLRRGLILAEGSVRELLPGLAETLGAGADHLQIWVDSPSLRTTLARDKVVLDGGHGKTEAKVIAAVAVLRERLIAALVASAGSGSGSGSGGTVEGASQKDARAEGVRVEDAEDAEDAGSEIEQWGASWGRAEHSRYSFLHGHLAAERQQLGARLAELPVLRERTAERAVTPAELARALDGRPLIYSTSGPSGPDGALLGLARAIGYPVIAGHEGDRPWLAGFSGEIGVGLVRLSDAIGEVVQVPCEGVCERVRAATEAALRDQGGRLKDLRLAIGDFVGEQPLPALVSTQLARGDRIVVLHSVDALASRAPATLWIDVDEPLLRVANKAEKATPVAAVLGLAAAIAGLVGGGEYDPEKLAEAARQRCGELSP